MSTTNITTLLKYSLKTNITKAILFDVITNTSRYYYTFGKTDAWPTETAIDENGNIIITSSESFPPSVVDSYNYELEVRKNAAFLKLIDINDVAIVINRIQWKQGFIYDMYDEYSFTNPSFTGATSLDQASFYVLNSRFQVFKCLFNNGNRPSTEEPVLNETAVSLPIRMQNDGYIWKYMYSIPLSLRNKFLSDEYMPVNTALTNSFYSNGAISGFTITDPGKNIPQFRRIKILGIRTAGTNYGTINLNFSAPLFVIDGLDPVLPTATVAINPSNGSATNISFTQGQYLLADPRPQITFTNLGLGSEFSTWEIIAGNKILITKANHGYSNGDEKYFEFISKSGEGTKPIDNKYSISNVSTDSFEISYVSSDVGLQGSNYIIPLATWTSTGTTTTITRSNHGLANNSTVELSFLESGVVSPPPNGNYTITVLSASEFTIPSSSSGNGNVIIRKIASGFELEQEYEEDIDSGFTRVEIEGDGRSLYNAFSIKEVAVENRGLFTSPISGDLFVFPSPPTLDLGNPFTETPRKPSLDVIFRAKQIREATWSINPSFPNKITVNKTLHNYSNDDILDIYFDSVNIGSASTYLENKAYTLQGIGNDTPNSFEIPISNAYSGNVSIDLGTATWAVSSNDADLVTITKANHGYVNGTSIYFTFTGTTKPSDGIYSINVVDTNSFTLSLVSPLIFGPGVTTLNGNSNLSITGATWQSEVRNVIVNNTTVQRSRVTITKNNFGLSTNTNVILNFTSGIFRPANTSYTITNVSENIFTVDSDLPLTRSGNLSVNYAEFDWSNSSSSIVTVSKTNHGYTTGDNIYLEFVSVTSGVIKPSNSIYTIISTTTDAFTVASTITQVITGKGRIDQRAAKWTYTAGDSFIQIEKKNHGLLTGNNVTLIFDESAYEAKIYSVVVSSNDLFRVSVPSRTSNATGVVRVDSRVFLEIDRVDVNDGGYGYDKPLRLLSSPSSDTNIYSVSSILLQSLATIVVNPSLVFTESLQRNEGFVKPIISTRNVAGEERVLENLVIIDPGVGYTNITATVKSYFIDGGQPFLITPEMLPGVLNDPSEKRKYKEPKIVLGISQGNTDSLQSDVEIQAKDGSIEVILVENGGSGYSSNTHSLVVVGDGTDCEADLIIENGAVTGVLVQNSGSNYTNASFTIVGDTKPDFVGDNNDIPNPEKARFRAIISPKGGHGKDAIQELFARTIAFYTKLVGNENNQGILTDNSYRQVSIIKNPLTYGLNEYYKNSVGSGCILLNVEKTLVNQAAYENLSEDILLSLIRNEGQVNEKEFKFVFVGKKEIEATATSPAIYLVLLNPIDGRYIPSNSGVFKFTDSQNVDRVLSASRITPPSYDKLSGELLYINNRLAFNPSPEQAVTTTTLISF